MSINNLLKLNYIIKYIVYWYDLIKKLRKLSYNIFILFNIISYIINVKIKNYINYC